MNEMFEVLQGRIGLQTLGASTKGHLHDFIKDFVTPLKSPSYFYGTTPLKIFWTLYWFRRLHEVITCVQ